MPGNCMITGVDKLSGLENAITLFPNPTTDMVFVNSENSALTNSTIIICDLLGREMLTQTYRQAIHNEMAISLTHFESGTYLCRFVNNGKDVGKPVKLIVQK
ncbi:MAG: T9SS type A sorting domain-containing protein [Bacteroidota bacterium]